MCLYEEVKVNVHGGEMANCIMHWLDLHMNPNSFAKLTKTRTKPIMRLHGAALESEYIKHCLESVYMSARRELKMSHTNIKCTHGNKFYQKLLNQS